MSERELLIKRNLGFFSTPMPNLNEMTNEELRERAEILEGAFDDLFSDIKKQKKEK